KTQTKILALLAAVGCGTAPPPNVVHAPPVQQAAPTASVASAVAPAPAPVASTAPPAPPRASIVPKPVELVAAAIPLPGATAPVSLDFLFYEPEASRVWVPAGGSGSVDVFDIAKHGFTRIEGFTTAEREAHGKQRVLGPSAGAVAGSFAYIGDRA